MIAPLIPRSLETCAECNCLYSYLSAKLVRYIAPYLILAWIGFGRGVIPRMRSRFNKGGRVIACEAGYQ
jgi:hypothetical protein